MIRQILTLKSKATLTSATMENDKEQQLRQQLIDYISTNAPWHSREDLENYSVTALRIFKEEIDTLITGKSDKRENI